MSNNFFADVADFQRQVLGNTQPAVTISIDKTPGYATTMKGLQEELDELTAAVIENDIGGQVDALIDVIYFALGGLFQMGAPMAACWDAVHTKNMAKVMGTTHRGTVNDAAKPADWTPPNHELFVKMPKAFLDATELMLEKAKDYRTGVTLDDYFPFGHYSYLQMLHTKQLRLRSLIAVLENGHQPNFESLRDSVIDLLNYGAFYAEYLAKLEAGYVA